MRFGVAADIEPRRVLGRQRPMGASHTGRRCELAGFRLTIRMLGCGMSTQSRRRRLEAEDIGDVTVVNFIDKKIVDEQSIQVIGEQLFNLVDEQSRHKLLLNFGNVEYLSSSALGKFIALDKKIKGVGGRLVLCSIAPQIQEVFEITKLDRVFKIEKEEQAALQAF